MNYAKISSCDIADGYGVRVGFYVSGCTRKCKGCHNPEAQDFNYGKPFSNETKNEIIQLISCPYCAGLSILGGEPLERNNLKTVTELCKEVKEKFPDKDIWLWTGFLYEEVLEDDSMKEILEYLDYIVDGPFIEEKKDLSLRFCGSSNQRILKLHPVLEELPNHN